jgi:hypothetical protein
MTHDPFEVSMHADEGVLWLSVNVPPAAAAREIGDCLEKIARALALIEKLDFEEMHALEWQPKIVKSQVARFSLRRAYTDPLYLHRLRRAIEYVGSDEQTGYLH